DTLFAPNNVKCIALTQPTGDGPLGDGAIITDCAGDSIDNEDVPFEGPYSLVDIPGLFWEGKGGAALSNQPDEDGDGGDVIRDTIYADGDVDMWDAPMPPSRVTVSIRGAGFIKQVYKEDVY